MSVRMRHTRGHTNNRRSHHGIKEPLISKCSTCNAPHIRHHVCEVCGMYRGRKVLNMEKKQEKLLKKAKEKEKAQ